MTMVLPSLLAAAALTAPTVPDWSFVPEHQDQCVSVGEDERWVSSAVPTGTPPAGGWPVYVSFVTDLFPVVGKTCGKVSPGSTRKNYTAFATPQASMQTCNFTASPSPPATLAEAFEARRSLDSAGAGAGVGAGVGVGSACDDAMTKQCSSAAKQGFMQCENCARGPEGSNACSKMSAYEWCKEHSGSGPSPPWPPHHHGGGCMYDQEAGGMWDQRMKQFLLTNGVAVIQINPHDEDEWDAYQSAWDQNKDKVWLPAFFKQLTQGSFGKLNAGKTVLRGWSGGAQMVSWLMQIIATQPTIFPGVTMAGGVMLSGGSYTCYNDPNDPDTPLPAVGSCQGCAEGGPSHCQGDPKCDSCVADVKPYCGQCCPKNYTEAYYDENPDKWSNHPPIFLSQTSTIDNHADLCACKNYYETLQAHGVKSELVLVPKEDESCFCIGNPSNPAAAGSPFSHLCTSASWGQDCSLMGGPECCISHTMGNANMVVPATQFIMDVTA